MNARPTGLEPVTYGLESSFLLSGKLYRRGFFKIDATFVAKLLIPLGSAAQRSAAGFHCRHASRNRRGLLVPGRMLRGADRVESLRCWGPPIRLPLSATGSTTTALSPRSSPQSSRKVRPRNCTARRVAFSGAALPAPWQTTGEFRVARGRGDDVRLPPDRCPQLARADLTDAEMILARGRAALDRLQHLAVGPVLQPALPGRDDVVGTVHADRRPAIPLCLVDEHGLAPARLAVDESVDGALAPPLEEGGLGAGGVLFGRAGNFLQGLDEVVMASLDQAFIRRFVDLGQGEGRVLADVEKGPLDAGGELLKVCAAEETSGHWMLPLPPSRRCNSLFYKRRFWSSQLSIVASVITCFQVKSFEITIRKFKNLAPTWFSE